MFFLSVIVPVYNVEKYLRRCIDSITIQNGFDKTEVILVDDGSTDSSGSVCDEYSAKYGNIITIHKANGGLSDARNTGIARANGTYIAFLDSDDLVSDCFIGDMLVFTEKYSPDMISFGYVFEKKSGQYAFAGDKSVTEKTRDEVLKDLLTLKLGNQVCFNLYRKDLFTGISFPKGRSYEDIATLYRLIMKAESFISVNRSYYVYNVVNDGSITKATTLKNMTDMYWSVNEQCSALEVFCEEKEELKEQLRYYRLNELIYIYVKVRREIADSEAKRALISDLENDIRRIGKVKLSEYKPYSLKKYIYYRLTHIGDKGNGTDR